MNRSQYFSPGINSRNQLSGNRGKKYRLTTAFVAAALVLIYTVQSHGSLRRSAITTLFTDSILACLPGTTPGLKAIPGNDFRRVDAMSLKAKGLLPNTVFTVFLTGLAGVRFGEGDYIGELTTNAEGRGAIHVDAVIDDAALSSTRGVERNRARMDVKHAVVRLTSPTGEDFCFAPPTSPNSTFDTDSWVGNTTLSSANIPLRHTASIATIFRSEFILIDDSTSKFQTINWGLIKCGYAF